MKGGFKTPPLINNSCEVVLVFSNESWDSIHFDYQNNSLQIPPFRKFWTFSRGGDLYKIQIRAAPAAGFLRKWILPSILPWSVWTLFKDTIYNQQTALVIASIKCNIQVFLEFMMENTKKRNCLLDINISNNLK